MKKIEIEVQPVGVNTPTRFDIVGIDQTGTRYFLTYCDSNSQAETCKKSILDFLNNCLILNTEGVV